MNTFIKIILLISFTCFVLFLQGQRYFTVCAESGLTLRSKADIDSERLQVVPYFHKVESIQLHRDNLVVIDDVKGYWIEVNYNGTVGFMFSGYLIPRDYGFRQTDLNFVFLDEYEDEHESVENGTEGKLDFTKYDPSLYWYGVKISDDRTIIRKIELKLDIYPNAIQKLHDQGVEGHKTPLQDSVATLTMVTNKDEYNFFIGAKKELETTINSRNYEQDTEDAPGIFLQPFQPIRLLSGQNLQSEIVTDREVCNTTYEVFLLNNQYQQISDFNWGGKYKKDIRAHFTYQSPRIVWEGDINNDGINDLMFHVSPMEDKCVRNYHMIYMSEKAKSGQMNFKPYYGVNLSSMDYY